MSTDFDVRPARPGDAPALAELRLAFKREDEDHQPPDEAAFRRHTQAWIRDRLADGRWLAWVAVSADEICGHVFLQPVERLPDPHTAPHRGTASIGYVTNFYVTPAHRNRGIGTALLRALAGHARARAFNTLIVWPSERSATLYRRAGYRTPDELLELPLDAGH